MRCPMLSVVEVQLMEDQGGMVVCWLLFVVGGCWLIVGGCWLIVGCCLVLVVVG